jgi:hypothetical protein
MGMSPLAGGNGPAEAKGWLSALKSSLFRIGFAIFGVEEEMFQIGNFENGSKRLPRSPY